MRQYRCQRTTVRLSRIYSSCINSQSEIIHNKTRDRSNSKQTEPALTTLVQLKYPERNIDWPMREHNPDLIPDRASIYSLIRVAVYLHCIPYCPCPSTLPL